MAGEQRHATTTGASNDYGGPLASSILLDDDEADAPTGGSGPRQPLYGGYGDGASTFGPSPLLFGQGLGESGGAASSTWPAPARVPNRTPNRTPSPVYSYQGVRDGPSFGDEQDEQARRSETSRKPASAAPAPKTAGGGACSSSTKPGPGKGHGDAPGKGHAPEQSVGGVYPQVAAFPPWWNPAQAYYGMMMSNPGAAAALGAGGPGGDGKGAMDPMALQVMMSMQQGGPAQSPVSNTSPMLAPCVAPLNIHSPVLLPSSMGPTPLMPAPLPAGAVGEPHEQDEAPAPGPAHVPAHVVPGVAAPVGRLTAGHGPGLGGGAGGEGGKRGGKRGQKEREHDGRRLPSPEGPVAAGSVHPREQRGGGKDGGKGDGRRRRGGGGGQPFGDDGHAEGGGYGGGGGGRGSGGKSRSSMGDARPHSNAMVEQLRSLGNERNLDLGALAPHISEIAQDQYGSRLIQQKLEVASEADKQLAFKAVLLKMPQLTTDVFGNYVVQKFFEFGSAEQRRILAEQLLGQVFKLSLHMYGCRVVQKALDSVLIDQQVLLIGELKGHVIACIEDQHGNHVIQKCIESLPTDKIGFVVDSFHGQTARMAKHCYGCRVIQRLIEYCAPEQLKPLLDEVLRTVMDLATDQYGNYVVQHAMEHSSRAGDRATIMAIVRQNVLSLSCHKYASNVIEKALACSTYEERGLIIDAITGTQAEQHPPLLTMMRDRFGNYIVQRVIALAQGPQRDNLLWKLHEHMPALKKSNTYGKHIISALEKAENAKD